MPPMTAELRELKVAKEWRKDPADWRRLKVDDRAQMMAFEIFMSTCQQYRDEFMEEKRKRDQQRKEKGSNPYHEALRGFKIPIPGQ